MQFNGTQNNSTQSTESGKQPAFPVERYARWVKRDASGDLMIDVRMQTNKFGGDVAIEDGDLQLEDGLATSVLISLLSDARVGDQAGWCLEDRGDRFGSTLWMLRRSKATTQTRIEAEQMARDALAWLVEDGIAASVTVRASFLLDDMLVLAVSVARSADRRWRALWQAVGEMEAITIEDSLRIEITAA